MKITFESYSDIGRLQQLCLFAQHTVEKIEEMRKLDERRADQMEGENSEWLAMDRKLRAARPNEEVTL